MALSQLAKDNLELAIHLTAAIVGWEAVRAQSPAAFVERAISGKMKDNDSSINIGENCQEAEQFLAGIMGMM